MILGYATKDGTNRYSKRFPSFQYKELGETSLYVSELGFGSYRVDISVESHHIALKKALKEGINLIDTSSNYFDGGSEKLICSVINSLIEENSIKRDELVIITKGGYIQGGNYDLSKKRKEEGRPFEDLVEYSNGLEHCISPQFLKEQISMSLMRLGLETVDFYLLHNPEYYLSWAKKQNVDKKAAREEYYKRIKKAFAYLEEEVTKGRIKYYGISSNTFPKPCGDFEATELKRVIEIAESLKKDHHFKLIQFPMNLFECSPGFDKTISLSSLENGEVKKDNNLSLLEYIKSINLASLVNRPLNVLLKDKIVRLADVTVEKNVTEVRIDKFIDDMLLLENKFNDTFIHTIELDDKTKKELKEYISISSILKKHWRGFANYTQWYDVFSNYFTPRVNSAIHVLTSKELSVPLSYWVDNYVQSLERVFRAIDGHYKMEAHNNNIKIKEILENEFLSFGDELKLNKLSQIATYALRISEGIGSILVGMRQDIYVEDMLEGLEKKSNQKDGTKLWSGIHKNLSFLS